MATGPRTISAKHLASAVDQAVKTASQRHNLQFGPAFSINGIINGRQLLQAAADLSALRQAATDIANEASRAAGGAVRAEHAGAEHAASAGGHLHLEPAVLIGPNHIICGWINPENVTLTFE
jgi:hypothetical protein